MLEIFLHIPVTFHFDTCSHFKSKGDQIQGAIQVCTRLSISDLSHKKELETIKKKKNTKAEKMTTRRVHKAAKARFLKAEKAKKKQHVTSANSNKMKSAYQQTFSDGKDSTPCTQCQFRCQLTDNAKSGEGWLN